MTDSNKGRPVETETPAGFSGPGSRKPQADVTFDEGLRRLEELVRKLEENECSLEEALALFEKGVKLTRLLNERLDQAEAKIEILTRQGGGEVVEIEGETSNACDA